MLIENMAALVLLLGLAFITDCSAQVCEDLDSTACKLLFNAKPDLCSDASLANTCSRFCGLCPIECYDCQTPVRDPSTCVQSQSCRANQTCMLKELLAVDGHHEYIMSCVDKSVCELFGNGFGSNIQNILGRRDEPRHMDKRDISVTCCGTDNCNKPMVATTPPTTHKPTMPSTTHQPPPPTGLFGCHKDLAIAVDSSGSVGTSNFMKVLDFVSKLIAQFAIGPQETRVALETFASNPHSEWRLDTYSNQQALQAAVHNVRYNSGGTRTDLALQYLIKNVLHANGDRPQAPNVVLVITDGKSNQPALTINAAKQLHSQSTNVIAIGIGSGISKSELSSIATDANHVIDLTDFHQLVNVINKVHALVCS